MGLLLAGLGSGVGLAQEPDESEFSLTLAPPILPADGTTQPVIYLQLLDPEGAPRLATAPTSFSLSSSNPGVATVAESVEVAPGHSFGVASVTTSRSPGRATITASGAGGPPVTAELETVPVVQSAPPLTLKLAAAPGNLVAGANPPGRLTIASVGADGRAVPAPQRLEIVVNSSNPEALRVADRVTLEPGEYFTVTPLTPGQPGKATLSAVHSGYASEFVEVEVVEPKGEAEAIALFLSPPLLHLGAGGDARVVAQAVNGEGFPVLFPCATVTLASSDPEAARVPERIGEPCQPERQYVSGEVTAGSMPGEPTITATASGLRPSAESLLVQGRVPTQLSAYLVPPEVLRVESPAAYLVVQSLDADGVPSQLHRGLPLTVVGATPLDREPAIPANHSFAALELSAPDLGDAQIWTVSPGLAPVRVSLVTRQLPLTVAVESGSGPVFVGEEVEVSVRVTSADAPLGEVAIDWNSPSGILREFEESTDASGEARATFLATVAGDSLVEVTVAKGGYQGTRAETQVPVVAVVEPENTRPSLYGIPVIYLTGLIVLVLLGYLGVKVWSLVSRRVPVRRPRWWPARWASG